MEKSNTIQNETSWLTVICGACGILLLAAYILWGPDKPQAPPSMLPEKSKIQQQSFGQPVNSSVLSPSVRWSGRQMG